MPEVDSVERAEQVAELGVDALIAQGGEAGGLGGDGATMVLTPQVVDRVAPIPVLAAGGIADGRGVAAALARALAANAAAVLERANSLSSPPSEPR